MQHTSKKRELTEWFKVVSLKLIWLKLITSVRIGYSLMVTLTILLQLGSNAVTSRQDKSILYARNSIILLISIYILTYNGFHTDYLGNGIGIFHGLFHMTATTHIFHTFTFAICIIILNLNAFYPRKLWSENLSSLFTIIYNKVKYLSDFLINKTLEQYRIIEYPLVIIFVIIGGLFLMSSSDLISLFIAIELQSYGLYILCCMYRNSESSTSAGLTYFLLGGLSSCFILLASGLLYSNSGNTSFDGLYVINDIALTQDKDNLMYYITSKDVLDYIKYSLIIMSVGLLFKVTAAPFHIWSPDVYDAIPTIVTTFVAIFTKISIFILLLEIVHYTSNLASVSSTYTDNDFYAFDWTYTLLVSSLASLLIGSILGLTQSRIKRLYAYSTISHVGFILLALVINSVESIQAFLFYLMQYSLSNLNAFLILIAIGYSLYMYTDNSNGLLKKLTNSKESPIQLTNQIKGYFNINPAISISLAITIFSFAGIPPLVGFFAKQMVLSSALDSGYVFMSLIAILTSVISAYYYLTLVKQMFFSNSDYVLNPSLNNFSSIVILTGRFNKNESIINVNNNNVSLSSSLSVYISILTLIILLFILNPNDWLSLTSILSLIIFN